MQVAFIANAAITRAASFRSAVVARAVAAMGGSVVAGRSNATWRSSNRGSMIRIERSGSTERSQSLREVEGMAVA